MADFCHLHAHTQYSLLDGASSIERSVAKAVEDGQKALAITDHGNMFGAFKFFSVCDKNGIKPIIGCETYVVEDRFRKEFKKGMGKDVRFHQLLLAKNAQGYQNLMKLCSLGFIDGSYRGFPRVDKDLVKQYAEGLIATTCCIGAEVPQTILKKGEAAGEEVFKEWLDVFGEDYYIELQRHDLKDIDGSGLSQEDINQILIKYAKKYNVKIIATNDSHYVEEEDWEAHDIMLCLQTGSDLQQEGRFRFPNNQFYLKSKAEMGKLFQDLPQALDNTIEIVDKVESLNLKRDILLPNYQIPDEFKDQNDYLRHITYEGAKDRYQEITADVRERLDMELGVIQNMGFSGYFLIVQDFIKAAKEMGVSVGPGRGSGAGSAVAFTTGITNIEPLKYNLLFERFLNPERVSMPDFDIDFDDEGRQQVIDYVIDKYGKEQVAQIVTYGTMGAKTSLRDVGRVMKVPLPDVNRVAKLVPERPGTNFASALKEVPELKALTKEEVSPIGKMFKKARELEGCIRHKGIHAAGVIIAPGNITNYVPVCTAKGADLWVTQFDGKVIEDAGMLKMDFLGLRTLSIIKDAIWNIRDRHGVEIDPDEIPLDDQKTFELYQRGETKGIFQFESSGMATYLKQLKPNNIEDLIAMNALFRPGPMDHIPSFIARKHGREKVVYPHEWLKEILEPTYGIMVYQEQIMQAAQIMAGFSLGSADILRRAMGKKKASEMEKQKVKFVEGATEKGVDEKQAIGIFNTMAKFAEYGFNRSHSAAYSVLSYQTGYLKAHYPAEYMASVLTHNMGQTKSIYFFLSECKNLGIEALVPDINESRNKFRVNEEGAIRFGMGGIKGVGSAVVEQIVEEREKNGPFTSLFDLTSRIPGRTLNRKCLESLALAGAFDSFGNYNRRQYVEMNPSDGVTGIELAIKYGQQIFHEKNSAQASLFGGEGEEEFEIPKLPDFRPWPKNSMLAREREVTGIYLSGHPLNVFHHEISTFCNCRLNDIEDMKGRVVKVAGIVTGVEHRVNQNGSNFGKFTIEDYSGEYILYMYRDDYLKWKHLFEEGQILYLTGNYKLRYKSEDRYDLRIQEVKLLESMGTQAKEIEMVVPLQAINDDFIAKMEAICKKNPGKMKFNFKVKSHGHTVHMASDQMRLAFDNEVFAELQELGLQDYKIKA